MLVLILALGAGAVGCDDRRERRSRIAVRSLAACPESKVEQELAKVLSYGRYALPDIEQELPVSPKLGRLRLLRALARLADPEALPFVRHVARWDEQEEVRQRAAEVARELAALPRPDVKPKE